MTDSANCVNAAH